MPLHRQESRAKPYRVLLIFLAVATLWRVWLPSPQLPAAYGQIPDSGKQRQEILDEARRTNQLLMAVGNASSSEAVNIMRPGMYKE